MKDGCNGTPYAVDMRLLLATTNAGKAIEIREALSGLAVECLTLKDIPSIKAMPEETGTAYIDNAKQKAIFCYDHAGLPTLADDSGIVVEALAGELGIHTRRWGAGKDASDEAWIAHFLHRMSKEPNKRARFICALAYIDGDGTLHTFEGETTGAITETLEASYLPGLPISACFKPDGCGKVYSALTVEEKNALSHRGKALGKLRGHLVSAAESV